MDEDGLELQPHEPNAFFDPTGQSGDNMWIRVFTLDTVDCLLFILSLLESAVLHQCFCIE